MHLLDLFFPKRCVNCKKFGSYICSACFASISFQDDGICIVCQRAAIDGLTHPACKTANTIDGVFSSLVYKGSVKKLVYKFKYPPFLTDMQSILVDLFYEGLIQKEQFYTRITSETVLMPVPLHKDRLRIRGYNQSQLLAEGLAKRFGLSVWDGLIRVRNTTTQTKLSKQERKENMKGAFVVKSNEQKRLANLSQIFLIDDILTSGATIAEAGKSLKKAGARRIFGVTLAHGE